MGVDIRWVQMIEDRGAKNKVKAGVRKVQFATTGITKVDTVNFSIGLFRFFHVYPVDIDTDDHVATLGNIMRKMPESTSDIEHLFSSAYYLQQTPSALSTR